MSAGAVGIGTPACPWYIRVGRGQRVNLTLFNFISPTLATSGESAAKVADTCYHVGVVRDGPERRQRVTACSNEPRQRTVLVSSSNSVSFEFAVRGLNVRSPDHNAHFLVHYDGQKFSLFLLAFHLIIITRTYVRNRTNTRTINSKRYIHTLPICMCG